MWLAAALMTGYGTLIAIFYLRKGGQGLGQGLEPISILKPLKGVDEGIEENLKSFLDLDYPSFEILFSVADELDPVVPIVRKLLAMHPHVRATLKICKFHSGPNPKINNLLSIYQDAKYDWILISDSNTRMSPQHLRVLAQQFKKGVAMQSSVVAGVEASSIGGLLECAFLNTFYARSVLILNTLGHPCVIGKAMMFRKSVLERTGGLRSLEVHIAEDYAAGKKLQQLGFRVQISRNPIRQHIGRYGFITFWTRHIRWGRLRKMQAPLVFLVEPFFNSIISGLVGAFAFSKLFGSSPYVFFAAHVSGWFLLDLIVFERVDERPDITFLPIWILREFLHFPLWIHIAMGNTINWRGKIIHLVKPKMTRIESYTFHGLQEFLRHPDQHLYLKVKNPLDSLADAYSLFDEEWEENLKPSAKTVENKKRPPEENW